MSAGNFPATREHTFSGRPLLAQVRRPPTDPEHMALSPVGRLAAIAALSLLVTSVHLALGPNFILDDWYNVAYGVDPAQPWGVDLGLADARPGLLAAYGLTFGVFGNHPVPHFVVLSLLNAASAALLFDVVGRFASQRLAAIAAVVWVVSPNHMAIEAWPSTSMIGASLVLALLGVSRIARDEPSRRSDVIAVVAFTVSSAMYEASIPVIALATVALPWIVRGRPRYGLVTAVGAGQLAVAGWILLNWHPAKSQQEMASLASLLPAHFGDGLVGNGIIGAIVMAAALVGATLVANAAGRRRIASTPLPLIAAGAAIIAAGTVPFLFYFYSPYGPGDRVLYISAIGSTLIIATVLDTMIQHRKAVGLGATASLLVLMGAFRWEQSRAWDWAGDQGILVMNEIEERHPNGLPDRIAVGPVPVDRLRIAPFLDSSNVQGAINVYFPGTDARAFMTHNDEDFATFDRDAQFDIFTIGGGVLASTDD